MTVLDGYLYGLRAARSIHVHFFKRGMLKGGGTFDIVDNCFTSRGYEKIFSPYGTGTVTHIGPIISWVRYRIK